MIYFGPPEMITMNICFCHISDNLGMCKELQYSQCKGTGLFIGSVCHTQYWPSAGSTAPGYNHTFLAINHVYKV